MQAFTAHLDFKIETHTDEIHIVTICVSNVYRMSILTYKLSE